MSELSESDICTRAIPPIPTVTCEGEFHMDKACREACQKTREDTLKATQKALCEVYKAYRAMMLAKLADLEAAYADCTTRCNGDQTCILACAEKWDPLVSQLKTDWGLFRVALNESWNKAVQEANAAYTTCAIGCCKAD